MAGLQSIQSHSHPPLEHYSLEGRNKSFSLAINLAESLGVANVLSLVEGKGYNSSLSL